MFTTQWQLIQQQSNFSCFTFAWLTSLWTVTHSFTAIKISFKLPYSNTGWTVVFAMCWPDYTLFTLTGTGKEVIVPSGHRLRPELHCSQATSSSSVLVVSGFIKCESHQRVEWSAICSPINRRVKAWLNKEPIHALVDSRCSLIRSLSWPRWTLLFAGWTCVLVKQAGRASSLSTLKWYGWKITSCTVGERLCVSVHTPSLPCLIHGYLHTKVALT